VPENPTPPDATPEERTPPRKPPGIWLLIIVALLIMIAINAAGESAGGKKEPLSFIAFMDRLRDEEDTSFKSILLEENRIVGEYNEGYLDAEGNAWTRFETLFPRGYFDGPEGSNEIARYVAQKDIEFKLEETNQFWQILLVQSLPFILLIVLVWFLFFRRMGGAGGPGGVLSFGSSRARRLGKENLNVTFGDVAGNEEAKQEVQEIILFLKDPARFARIGGRIPRGVLLVGPPGTGKTLLAKAIAGESGVPFFSISGSDFVEMFVGVGASRVRDLFKQAKEAAPAIIFLDEIDAVGRRRGTGLGGGHDEREQTLNAILVEMDGFETESSVIVLASTNRPDVLDPALLRPGRFDREVVLGLPDVRAREQILKVHGRKVKLRNPEDLEIIAKTTPGYSGAELEAVINEAAIRAVMKDKNAIDSGDLEEARDKVRYGRQRISAVVDAEDKKLTAYHEAGHAILGAHIEGSDPVHKVSIIPRGMAGGVTMYLPEKDHQYYSKQYLLNMITMLFGGRVAEEIFLGDISGGAQNDIKRATDIARRMVCEWGMSEAVGPINYSSNEETLFLGREVARSQDHSEETSQLIDSEIKRIVDECLERARQMINQYKDECETIALALLKLETIHGEDVDRIVKDGWSSEQVIEHHRANSFRDKEVTRESPKVLKPVDEKDSSPTPGTTPFPEAPDTA
jgi:cell division protease FtsH